MWYAFWVVCCLIFLFRSASSPLQRRQIKSFVFSLQVYFFLLFLKIYSSFFLFRLYLTLFYNRYFHGAQQIFVTFFAFVFIKHNWYKTKIFYEIFIFHQSLSFSIDMNPISSHIFTIHTHQIENRAHTQSSTHKSNLLNGLIL